MTGDCWIKIDQLDVTCFIISLFTAHHFSNVSTSIFRRTACFSLHKVTTPPQPNHTVKSTHIAPEQHNTWNKSTTSRKLLKMDVLAFETCWAVNSEIIKQVTSSWSIFIQLSVVIHFNFAAALVGFKEQTWYKHCCHCSYCRVLISEIPVSVLHFNTALRTVS